VDITVTVTISIILIRVFDLEMWLAFFRGINIKNMYFYFYKVLCVL
jgi:hypothetical protein